MQANERNGSDELSKDETRDLISSEKVDGKPVYTRSGERLGTIHHFMVGKRDGQVRYAVMNYGGLFGMGTHHYPLPWEALDYEDWKGGYIVDLDKDKLDPKEAPSFPPDEEPVWDEELVQRLRLYYFATVTR